MILTIKKRWRRLPVVTLMRCGGCRPLRRRGVGGLSDPLSVPAASCTTYMEEPGPLLPVDDMEFRDHALLVLLLNMVGAFISI